MASRQQNLFAAEDWKIAYKAYSEINFQAYDFDTIRGALVEYVKTNFPENFNDYIESSEFIAIIEMLAYLSQSIAFRVDLNTRENFLETAESRDSVFKLARMLGYNPKRNIPASGLMKLTSVKTSEPLTDSLGNDLSNRTIYWDDINNNQSYEQFITVINAVMSKTNRFSSPIKQGTVGGVRTELYQLNTPQGSPIVYPFNVKVNGKDKPFTVVNPDFDDNSHFYERHPDPTNLLNLIYRNDGGGISSDDTGFFVFFRQGVLEFQDLNYTTPLENRLEEIAKQNIAENDVYLQEINSGGLPLNKWSRVPNTVGQTINYNSTNLNTRNLYAIENIGTQGVRLRFTDGNFGNVPVGIFRFWHRISDPTRYTIQPEDAKNLSIQIPYENKDGRSHTLTIRFSLNYSVNNSLPAESAAAIKERAPQTYYTQNRMVSAQDYNVFPQSQSSNIRKLKAINKTHAGHSRYIDLNDPTGTYQNVDTFADDAFLYVENENQSENVIINSNTTALDVLASVIPAKLKSQGVSNFAYYGARNVWTNPVYGGSVNNFKFNEGDNVVWNTLPIKPVSNTGYMSEEFSTGSRNVLVTNNTRSRQFKPNTFLKWQDPEDPKVYKWVRVISVENSGQLNAGISTSNGPWTLSEEIPAGWRLVETVVSLRTLFTKTETQTFESAIKNRETFALGYDFIADAWYKIPESEITTLVKEGKYQLNSISRGPSSWLILMEYSAIDINSYRYTMTTRSQDYVVQSANDLKFYNIKNVKVVDRTNKSSQDMITFTTANAKPADSELYKWQGETQTWLNEATGIEHRPLANRVNLPLRSRDTTWQDVNANWISNFGILRPTQNTAQLIAGDNEYVKDATISLNTYKEVGAITRDSNVVIGNNLGQVVSLPNKIKIRFNNRTFGENIVKVSGSNTFVTYRQIPSNGLYGSEVVFVAKVGQSEAYSYGADGSTLDSSTTGRLTLLDYDPNKEAGNLLYDNIQENDMHWSKDGSGYISQDKLELTYISNKSNLEEPIIWSVQDVYRETDGYTDPRKVKVAPLDVDGDLVPDDPRQFAKFVGVSDLILFEYYKDLQGYTYDKPVEGVIMDYRGETTIAVDNARNTIARGSDRSSTVQLSSVNWVLVDTLAIARELENKNYASGIVVYVAENEKVYKLMPNSTAVNAEILLVESKEHFVRHGRGKTQDTNAKVANDCFIRWQHVAPNDVRIDPSISNIVEMLVLTSSYADEVQKWKAQPNANFPLEPTSNELASEFTGLNTYKSASDSLIYRSAKFKLLFGDYAQDQYKARFRVVKLSDQLSDNELKTQIISTINNYFEIANWEFGETFYFTELSTYIHQRLGSSIGSIVILPKKTSGKFGEMFQVQAEPNELFISTATVNDIEIISRLDNQTLRTDR